MAKCSHDRCVLLLWIETSENRIYEKPKICTHLKVPIPLSFGHPGLSIDSNIQKGSRRNQINELDDCQNLSLDYG
jgi:hypothetical protein